MGGIFCFVFTPAPGFRSLVGCVMASTSPGTAHLGISTGSFLSPTAPCLASHQLVWILLVSTTRRPSLWARGLPACHGFWIALPASCLLTAPIHSPTGGEAQWPVSWHSITLVRGVLLSVSAHPHLPLSQVSAPLLAPLSPVPGAACLPCSSFTSSALSLPSLWPPCPLCCSFVIVSNCMSPSTNAY